MENKLIIIALLFIIGCKKESIQKIAIPTPPQSKDYTLIIKNSMFYEVNGVKDTAYGQTIIKHITMNQGENIEAKSYSPYQYTTITNGVAYPHTGYNSTYLAITFNNDTVSSSTCSCINQITYYYQ